MCLIGAGIAPTVLAGPRVEAAWSAVAFTSFHPGFTGSGWRPLLSTHRGGGTVSTRSRIGPAGSDGRSSFAKRTREIPTSARSASGRARRERPHQPRGQPVAAVRGGGQERRTHRRGLVAGAVPVGSVGRRARRE